MKIRDKKPFGKVLLVLILSFGIINANTFSLKAYDQVFFERISKVAVEMGKETGRFPSVAIAQAILESAWGKSSLARNKNNILGIKLNNGSYREFSSIEESMRYYSTLFTKNARLTRRYRKFLNAKTPQEAAMALNNVYAMSSSYGSKLIRMMNRYNLYQFDKLAGFNYTMPQVSGTGTVAKKIKVLGEKLSQSQKQEELSRLEKLKTASVKHEEAYERVIAVFADKYDLSKKVDVDSIEFDGVAYKLKSISRSVLEKGE